MTRLLGRLLQVPPNVQLMVLPVPVPAILVLAAVVAGIWGVSAERRSLEDVARPLSSVED